MLRRKLIKNRYSSQISLPKDFLKNLGWRAGDTLFVRQEGLGLAVNKLVNSKKRRGRRL